MAVPWVFNQSEKAAIFSDFEKQHGFQMDRFDRNILHADDIRFPSIGVFVYENLLHFGDRTYRMIDTMFQGATQSVTLGLPDGNCITFHPPADDKRRACPIMDVAEKRIAEIELPRRRVA